MILDVQVQHEVHHEDETQKNLHSFYIYVLYSSSSGHSFYFDQMHGTEMGFEQDLIDQLVSSEKYFHGSQDALGQTQIHCSVASVAAAAERDLRDRELYEDNDSPNVAMGEGVAGDEKSPNVDSVYHSVGGGDDAQMGG